MNVKGINVVDGKEYKITRIQPKDYQAVIFLVMNLPRRSSAAHAVRKPPITTTISILLLFNVFKQDLIDSSLPLAAVLFKNCTTSGERRMLMYFSWLAVAGALIDCELLRIAQSLQCGTSLLSTQGFRHPACQGLAVYFSYKKNAVLGCLYHQLSCSGVSPSAGAILLRMALLSFLAFSCWL